MSRMIFINLPVRNIAASTRFYEGIGFTRNPAFSDDETSCMVLSESIHVMIMTHGKWAGFTQRPIPDSGSSEVMLAVNCDSRDAVDALTNAVTGLGGTADINPAQDLGFMFSRSFADPDGHVWEHFWMDPAAIPPAP